MKRITLGVGMAIGGALAILAQEFEVASIKPSDPNGRPGAVLMRNGPGQVNFNGATLKLLIQQAYDVRESQISGGPGWINSARYDIVAKPPADEKPLPSDPGKATDEQRKTFQQRRQAMLQALLADRFQLKIHKDAHEQAVYVLAVAKGGPKLQEAGGKVSQDSGGPRLQYSDGPKIQDNGGPKLQDSGGKVLDPKMKPGMMRMGMGLLAGSEMDMEFLARALSQMMGRTVVNRTGLKGKYDFELKWTPDQSIGRVLGPPPGPPPPGFEPPPPPDPNGPTIFTALEEQLGLKLESAKGPVELIVIDHAEKPSEN